MTQLGKPLVFYLKYAAEMNRLYGHDEGEEPDLTGLEDAEQVREMVRTVGAAASEQAADFLALCGKEIEDLFAKTGSATLTKKKTRSYVVEHWSWEGKFAVPPVPAGSFWCGVMLVTQPDTRIVLPKDTYGLVVPWIWTKGGRRGAEAVWKILGGWPHSRGGEGLVDESATIALAAIPVKAQPPESFDVDRDLLIGEVVKTFGRIGEKATTAIASFVAGLNEPDES